MTATFDIAVIGGDGIGPEVVAEARRVLDAALTDQDAKLTFTEYSLGTEHWLATGETLSEETLQRLRGHDAILFGAVGADPQDARIPSGVIERDLLLKLRFELDHSINLRPVRTYPGVATPLASEEGFDFVVVREGTERAPTWATVVRCAAPRSRRSPLRSRSTLPTGWPGWSPTRSPGRQARRRHLTLVHKHNVLTHAGDLWRRTVEAEAAEHRTSAGTTCMWTPRPSTWWPTRSALM